jgi:hypothetical protein
MTRRFQESSDVPSAPTIPERNLLAGDECRRTPGSGSRRVRINAAQQDARHTARARREVSNTEFIGSARALCVSFRLLHHIWAHHYLREPSMH